MTRYSERTECTQVAPIFEGDEAEGDEDKENGFFVDMPAEEEGSVAAEGDCTDKGVPDRLEEQPDETDLEHVSIWGR